MFRSKDIDTVLGIVAMITASYSCDNSIETHPRRYCQTEIYNERESSKCLAVTTTWTLTGVLLRELVTDAEDDVRPLTSSTVQTSANVTIQERESSLALYSMVVKACQQNTACHTLRFTK